MKKRKKSNITTFKLNRDFVKTLDRAIDSGMPLEVGLGKYSCYITTKNDTAKYKFITDMQSKLTFVGYAKILKDLKREEISVLLSDMKDNVSEKNNLYFSMGKYESRKYESAVCVDLNSAYLQAMFNLSLITKETQEWIEKNLTKRERLVAVGMLAKQKEILHFAGGRIMQDYFQKSELRFVFNAIIQEVNNVMTQVQTHFIDDFIAYWVDGIYLKNEFMAFEVSQMFEDAGFPCKIEYLENFESSFKFSYLEYTYTKEGDFKSLNVPIKSVQNEMRKNLTGSINSRRIEKRLGKLDIRAYEGTSEGQIKKYSQADLFD